MVGVIVGVYVGVCVGVTDCVGVGVITHNGSSHPLNGEVTSPVKSKGGSDGTSLIKV
jgi:hypothetical protein